MPPYRSHIPPAAKPTRNHFDPWNASLTGHQRGENRIGQSLGWRATRTRRLQGQFRGENGEKGKEKEGTKRSVMDMLVGQGAVGEAKVEVEGGGEMSTLATRTSTAGSSNSLSPRDLQRGDPLSFFKPTPHTASPQPKKIFNNLTIHISGSTSPLISDHRLKQLLASHGALIALSPARRTVTHVIIGQPNSVGCGRGAGGGLAAGKIQREITRVRGGGGCGVRFVVVEWALESICNGKRLSEAAYSPLKLTAGRQRSVYGIFNVTKKDVGTALPGWKADEGFSIHDKSNDGGRKDVGLVEMDEEGSGGKENSRRSPSLAVP
ncbi:hypothetical protein FGG08_002348 [Glutinoglossum americanum]|uniref:BRCT domain-containing protein n=1 Tax=Glutinoglossum americanum TaxID=1670608 RepID=A0A9P8ICZ7_9PEZI|nr:hypothetical protein FGG08_002348 [Glutinoglossum americanum]